jgi:peptidoglycan/LPS O-acetylase OafA/YrhL
MADAPHLTRFFATDEGRREAPAPLCFRWWCNGGVDALPVVSLGLLGMLLRWAASRPDQDHPPDHAWHLPEGGLWAVVLLLLLLAPLATRAVLHNRVLARLGVLFYSIYMIHSPLVQLSLTAMGRRFGPVVWWSPMNMAIIAALTLVCVGLSEITYRYVELPFLRRKALLDG